MNTQQVMFLAEFGRTRRPSQAAVAVGATWADVFRWNRECSQFAAEYAKIDDEGNEGNEGT